MKIKNLSISNKLGSIGLYSMAGIVIAGSIAIQFVDKKKQVIDIPFSIEDFPNDGEEIYKEFLPGEHKIERTRVDIFYDTTEEPIEGYMIENVAVSRDINKITYVNTLPVVVEGKEHRDGTVTFDEFGEVITKDSVKTMGK